jgi:hypothetical protein
MMVSKDHHENGRANNLAKAVEAIQLLPRSVSAYSENGQNEGSGSQMLPQEVCAKNRKNKL